jgi:hypothetical protein
MADDDRPRLNAAHTFVVRDDVAGRDDPELRNTLTGSVVQHWPALDHINRHRRAGIFLALDSARSVLADFRTEEPRQALPVDPSLRVFCGYTHEWLPMYQFAWLVADDTPQRDRANIAAMLRTSAPLASPPVAAPCCACLARTVGLVPPYRSGSKARESRRTRR